MEIDSKDVSGKINEVRKLITNKAKVSESPSNLRDICYRDFSVTYKKIKIGNHGIAICRLRMCNIAGEDIGYSTLYHINGNPINGVHDYTVFSHNKIALESISLLDTKGEVFVFKNKVPIGKVGSQYFNKRYLEALGSYLRGCMKRARATWE